MKKVCVVSGTRADYGLLFWLMNEIQSDSALDLQLVVTGMHLSSKFGNTWKQIELDKFKISEKVDLGDLNDSVNSVADQVGVALSKFLKCYQKLKPDLVIILGDRYEMLGAAQAALLGNVPIAHIHGGEITEGAFDDMIRHSITKMSSYHFTSTEEYKKRVIRMGENPSRVMNVGAVGLENICKLEKLTIDEIETKLGFKLYEKNFLITYHPVTAANEDGTKALLKSLESFSQFGQIITLPNSDPGHQKIFDVLKEYSHNKKNVYLTTNLGSQLYLNLIGVCNLVIGNSSSGIIEAPFCGTATLNIGLRQKGRLKASSVLDVNPIEEEIISGLNFLLNKSFDKSFLYGDGNSAKQITKFIKSTDISIKKGFYDG